MAVKPEPDPFTVMCPFCHAEIGVQCRNTVTNLPLRRFLAHPIRMKAAAHE